MVNLFAAWDEKRAMNGSVPLPSPPSPSKQETVANGGTRWGLAALDAEERELRATAVGGRNARLNNAALKLGQLVAGGELDASLVTRRLTAAALAVGLTPSETAATIASGGRAGYATPRVAPPRGDLPVTVLADVEGPESVGAGQVRAPRSWSAVDIGETLDALIAGTLTRPAPTLAHIDGGGALLYPGRVNGIAGDSGSGKSWTALHACAQELAAGHCAVYVDLEDDAAGVLARLLDLGATPDDVRARFSYVHPVERFDVVAAGDLFDLLDLRRPSLVVIDSTGEALALDGAKPNEDDEVSRWFIRLPHAIATRGPAVLVLDHMAKADDGSGLWPIGTQRKRAAISGAQYIQKLRTPFAQGQAGAAVLLCAKDRGGTYRQREKVAELSVSPVDDGVRVALVAVEPTTGGGETFRPTALMEKVSRYLEAVVAPQSLRQVLGSVSGKTDYKKLALNLLVAEGYVSQSSGPRGAVLHSHVRPYREGSEPGERSMPEMALETASVTVPRSPASRAGERGNGHTPLPGEQSGNGRGTGNGQPEALPLDDLGGEI